MTLMEYNPDLRGTYPNTVSLYIAKFKARKEKVNKFITTLRMIGDFDKHGTDGWVQYFIEDDSVCSSQLNRKQLKELIIKQEEVVGLIVPEKRFMWLLIYTEDSVDYNKVLFRFNKRLPMNGLISELKKLGICV